MAKHIKLSILLTTWIALLGLCSQLQAQPSTAADNGASDAMPAYLGRVFTSLVASNTPRSLILASTIRDMLEPNIAANASDKRDLIVQAERNAPRDVFVQWHVAMISGTVTLLAVKQPVPLYVTDAATTLLDIDADNGVSWLVPLAVAAQAGSETDITRILEKIAASKRFEEYSVDMILEWLPFMRADPLPKGILPPVQASDEAIALLSAIALTMRSTHDMASHLFAACAPDAARISSERQDACLAVGKLLSSKANTMADQRVGARMLGVAGESDPEYLKAMRETEWLSVQGAKAFNVQFNDLAGVVRFEKDLAETHSDVAATRRLLARTGIPLTPPTDWQSPAAAPMPGDGG
jgi:hypothetical protein